MQDAKRSIVCDLFQKIVKSIATDENFDEADVAAEIAAIRTAAENAGATLPAESATSVTTGSNDSTENDSQDNTEDENNNVLIII